MNEFQNSLGNGTWFQRWQGSDHTHNQKDLNDKHIFSTPVVFREV